MLLLPCPLTQSGCYDGSCYCSRSNKSIIYHKWHYFVQHVVFSCLKEKLSILLSFILVPIDVLRTILVKWMRLHYHDFYMFDYMKHDSTLLFDAHIDRYTTFYSMKDNTLYEKKGYYNPLSPLATSLNHTIIIASGYDHTLSLTSDGSLYAIGNNDSCQLGLKGCHTWTSQTSLKRVHLSKSIYGSIINMACGYQYSVILTTKGLFSCGSNTSGQLGTNQPYTKVSGFNRMVARQYDSNDPIIIIACGKQHTMVVSLKGLIYGCGNNAHGELGIDTSTIPPSRPVKDNNSCYYQLTYTWGRSNTNESEQSELPPIVALSCGYCHSMVLTRSGKLYVCGSNEYGQLGTGSTNYYHDTFKRVQLVTKIKYISTGFNNSWVIDVNDTIYGSGDNRCNQLGSQISKKRNTFRKLVIKRNALLSDKDITSIVSGEKTLIITHKSSFTHVYNNIPKHYPI